MEEKTIENNVFEKCVKALYKCLNGNIPSFKLEKLEDIKLDINFFKTDYAFYSKLLKDIFNLSNFRIQQLLILKEINPEINRRNCLLFVKDLIALIDSGEKEIYKKPEIKLSISILIGYLCSEFGKKIINSMECFYIFRKEIEKLYRKNFKDWTTNFDDYWINEGKKKLHDFEEIKKSNFEKALNIVIENYVKNKLYEEESPVLNILDSFQKKRKQLSMENLEKEFFKNPIYQKYIEKYLDCQMISLGYIDPNNEFYQENRLKLFKNKFFQDILKVDINNIDDILCLLQTCSYMNKKKLNEFFFDIDGKYNEFRNQYTLILKESSEDLTEELKNILEGKDFFDNFEKILESNSVKKYLENKRNFNDEDNGIKILNKNEINFDDYLKKEYDLLLNNLKSDKKWIKNLIIFKFLPKKKRAFVNPYMRIIINPLFIKISEPLKRDKKKRMEIFKAYLNIILIHEIIHLLKFLKESFSYNNIPQTPKKKKAAKFLYNIYLEYQK